jgi:hypothetical protein
LQRFRWSPRASRWLDPIASVGLVVFALSWLWLRFNAPPGGGGSFSRGMTFKGDLLNYYAPMAEHVARRLRAGELPLWNPEVCSGMPLLATLQSAAFYPGAWLPLFLPIDHAFRVLLFLECALGGLFAAWLFRTWGFARFASSYAGVLFVFACCLGQALWPPALATIIWIPWLLLCVEKLSREWSARWWVALAVGCALQILAGFPQYLAYGYYLVAPLAALHLLEGRFGAQGSWGRLGGSALALASAVAIGIGLAGAQLLPTLELVGQSVRGEALTPSQVHYLTLHGHHGSVAVLRGALRPESAGITYAFGSTGYVGVATLLLIPLGVMARRREPRTWLLLALGAIALLLSDGYMGPGRDLYAAYAQIPFVGSLRTPERMRLVYFFCAIALAGAGFDAVERRAAQPRRRHASAALLLVVGLAAAVSMQCMGHGAAGWRVAVALGLALPLLYVARPWLRHGLAALLVLFVSMDLALATRETGRLREMPLERSHEYHAAWSVLLRILPGELAGQKRAAGSGRVELIHFKPHVGGGPSAGLRRVSCYEPLVPSQWAELHRKLTGENTRGATLFGIDPAEHPLFYDVTGVARILQPGRRDPYKVLVNHDALPRAFLVDRYRVADRDRILSQIAVQAEAEPSEGGFDFRREVLLDRHPGFPSGAAGGIQLRAARVVEDQPERVAVLAESPGNALLVLTDSHYPGWEAHVDGEPAEILLANGLHRAVWVGAGRHQVVFEYRPRSFRVGSLVSLASLLLLGVAVRGRR